MGLKTMSLSEAATVTVTGGTALGFTSDGVAIQNGIHLVISTDVDYQTRRQCTAKYRPPQLDPKTGSFSKDKKSISFSKPMVLTDGSVVFNTIRLEREVHPQLAAADALELNKLGAQLLTDADAAAFWAVGGFD